VVEGVRANSLHLLLEIIYLPNAQRWHDGWQAPTERPSAAPTAGTFTRP